MNFKKKEEQFKEVTKLKQNLSVFPNIVSKSQKNKYNLTMATWTARSNMREKAIGDGFR